MNLSPEDLLDPKKTDQKRSSLQQIVKLSQVHQKGRIIKSAREKSQVTLMGSPIRIATDLSAVTFQARRKMEMKSCIPGSQGEKSKKTQKPASPKYCTQQICQEVLRKGKVNTIRKTCESAKPTRKRTSMF